MRDDDDQTASGRALQRRMERARSGKPFYQFVGRTRGKPGVTDELVHQHALPTTGTTG